MSFCIRGKVVEFDATDLDRAMCGDCEKPLVFKGMGGLYEAECCGYRYAAWPSIYHAHRVPGRRPAPPRTEEGKP